ncbi:MAG: ATP-binding protein, partial [Alphaproteobacteria bacterium]
YAGVVHIPHAVEVDGQIIKIFDPMVHRPVADPSDKPQNSADAVRADEVDGRWVSCHRPVVMVGGELTLEALELTHSSSSGLHEAPLQMKANGGIFILDNLGRQRVSAKDLLNRWIIPMERAIDYLTLNVGTTIEVPFDSLLIFSTNLEPSRLMDPAFLRRIPYKIEMKPPSEAQYIEALIQACEQAGLMMSTEQMDYVLREVRTTHRQPLAFYQVGFVVGQIVAAARFVGEEPEVRQDLLDDALQNLSALPS